MHLIYFVGRRQPNYTDILCTSQFLFIVVSKRIGEGTLLCYEIAIKGEHLRNKDDNKEMKK